MKTFYITGFQGGWQGHLTDYFNRKFNSTEKTIKFILIDNYENVLEKRLEDKDIKIIYLKTNIKDIIENLSKLEKGLTEILEIFGEDISKFNVGHSDDFKYIADLYINQRDMSLMDIILKINDFINKNKE